jgi:hypothetical protein
MHQGLQQIAPSSINNERRFVLWVVAVAQPIIQAGLAKASPLIQTLGTLMSTELEMLYFLIIPIAIGVASAFIVGNPDKWLITFKIGAALLILSKASLIFQHKSDPSAAIESLMKLSGPIMAVGGFLMGRANVLVFKFFKKNNKDGSS